MDTGNSGTRFLNTELPKENKPDIRIRKDFSVFYFD